MAAHVGIVDTGVDRDQRSFKGENLFGIGVRRDGDNYCFVPRFSRYPRARNGDGLADRLVLPKGKAHAVRIAQEYENGAVVRVQERAGDGHRVVCGPRHPHRQREL